MNHEELIALIRREGIRAVLAALRNPDRQAETGWDLSGWEYALAAPPVVHRFSPKGAAWPKHIDRSFVCLPDTGRDLTAIETVLIEQPTSHEVIQWQLEFPAS